MGAGAARFLIAAATVLATAASAAADCAPDRIDIRVEDGVATFSVEIAADAASRSRGLMEREAMPRDHGMLFVYPSARPVAFWMKNTPLPLDIVYLNRRGVVCSIAARTTPFSLKPIPSGCAAQTVLELNAGRAAETGVKVGSAARHPAIERPVWRCE